MNKKNSKKKNDITVCYSGGIDSTYIGYVKGKEYKGKVHLLTLVHGYGDICHNLCYRHVNDLKRLLGEKNVVHDFIYIKPLFKKILINSLWRDFKKYKSMAIWCISCHLAFHTYVAIYNLINEVPYAMLCSSVRGTEYAPVSLTVMIKEMKDFYKKFGIKFTTPIVDEGIRKKYEKKVLRKNGIWPGFIIGKGTVGVQPLCLPGIIQTWPDTFFNIHPYYNEEKIGRFIREKKKIMNSYLLNYFKKRKLNLKEYIKRLKQ